MLLTFSDDTKGVSSVNSAEDAEIWQQYLDNLFKWSSDWQMLFNLDKYNALHFGAKNMRHTYSINGYPLSEVEEEKDLGVMIRSCCHPSRQVGIAAMKANRILG